MNVTIETINGKQYTVVWHDDVQSFNGTMTATHNGYVWHIGSKCVATLLPALPRHPKPEDARLLYLYASHGIEMYAIHKESDLQPESPYAFLEWVIHLACCDDVEITHALDSDGNKIEVAIEG